MRIVRQNATLCEVEIGERLKSTFTCEKWNLTFHFRLVLTTGSTIIFLLLICSRLNIIKDVMDFESNFIMSSDI